MKSWKKRKYVKEEINDIKINLYHFNSYQQNIDETAQYNNRSHSLETDKDYHMKFDLRSNLG